MRLIALMSDFGVRDHYNGVMRGVIYSINPDARVVDLAPEALAFSVMDAAFMLWASYSYFPRETVFLVVVDPGVGTRRAALAIRTRNYYFVGPDNGVLYPAASEDGIVRSVTISNSRYLLPNRTGTFDGRDVFAPAAAWISKGVEVEELGDEAGGIVKLEFGAPQVGEEEVVVRVLHVDRFGDVVTNMPWSMAEQLGRVELAGRELKVVRSFEDCGGLCLVKGSSGFIEIASDRASAAEALGVKTGDLIRLRRIR